MSFHTLQHHQCNHFEHLLSVVNYEKNHALLPGWVKGLPSFLFITCWSIPMSQFISSRAPRLICVQLYALTAYLCAAVGTNSISVCSSMH